MMRYLIWTDLRDPTRHIIAPDRCIDTPTRDGDWSTDAIRINFGEALRAIPPVERDTLYVYPRSLDRRWWDSVLSL